MARRHRTGNGRKHRRPTDLIPADYVHDIVTGTGGKIIRRKVRAAARRYAFQASDVEDLIQILTIHLWLQAAHFDSRRGTWPTYCTVVVDRHLKSVLQKKRRSMIHRFVHLPHESEIERDCLHPRRIDDPRAARELAADVEERIRRLPASLQEMCRRVQRTSLTEAAREMGVPRQTFVDRLRRLAEHFRILKPRNS